MKNNLKKLVKEVLDKSYLMSLATLDKEGVWVADVIFSYDEGFNIYWMSTTTRRHSKTIDKINPKVAATITATTGPEQPDAGLQLSGIAKRVKEIPWESVEKFFKKRKKRIPKPTEDFLDGHTWYKIVPNRIELICQKKFGYKRQSVKL